MLKKYPFYLKATVILFGLVLFFFALSILKPVLIPVSFGLMLAILLNPFVNWLERKEVNRTVAIAIAILFSLLFLALVTYFISSQIASFSDQMPTFKKKSI